MAGVAVAELAPFLGLILPFPKPSPSYSALPPSQHLCCLISLGRHLLTGHCFQWWPGHMHWHCHVCDSCKTVYVHRPCVPSVLMANTIQYFWIIQVGQFISRTPSALKVVVPFCCCYTKFLLFCGFPSHIKKTYLTVQS